MVRLLILALILASGPALAHITAEPRSVSSTGVTVTLIAEKPTQLLLTDATLVNGEGIAMQMTSQARGVETRIPETPSGCDQGTVVQGRHTLFLPFKVEGS